MCKCFFGNRVKSPWLVFSIFYCVVWGEWVLQFPMSIWPLEKLGSSYSYVTRGGIHQKPSCEEYDISGVSLRNGTALWFEGALQYYIVVLKTLLVVGICSVRRVHSLHFINVPCVHLLIAFCLPAHRYFLPLQMLLLNLKMCFRNPSDALRVHRLFWWVVIWDLWNLLPHKLVQHSFTSSSSSKKAWLIHR